MLIDHITSEQDEIRDRSLTSACQSLSLEALIDECHQLDQFRRQSTNLYHRVRALFFLYSIHRFHLPNHLESRHPGTIPFQGYSDLLSRRFEEAIDAFLENQKENGPGTAISSALSEAYHQLAFQTLADQVRRSVRTVRGNQWMFRMGHPSDHPLRLHKKLLTKHNGNYPTLRESTPVRMDLTHSAWSDIFFLGMDFPEGARVLNISVDLGVHGRDLEPKPPIEAYLRVIDEPLLRLTSVDLKATADITNLSDVFDFAKDYLGLLKAAVIASGIVPPGIEGSGQVSRKIFLNANRRTGPRHRNHLLGQRHSERLPACRLDQPSRGTHLAPACGPPAQTHLAHGRTPPKARRRSRPGPRHPRRMDRRFRRRLAGLGGRLARHQTYRGRNCRRRPTPNTASQAVASDAQASCL